MQDSIIRVGLIIVFALAFTTVFLFMQQLGSHDSKPISSLSKPSLSSSLSDASINIQDPNYHAFLKSASTSYSYHYLLVIGTTFIDTIDPVKVEIQQAVLKNWSLLHPDIKLIVFTDSEYWKERCNELHVSWTDSFETNPNNIPFFTSMTDYLQDHYQSTFYGYVNGDILIHSTLYNSLLQLSKQFHSSQHILVVGRRYNYPVLSGFLESLSSQELFDQFITDSTLLNEQFIPVAQDFFIFSKNTLTKKNVAPVVIGRNRYDNYLLTVCKLDPSCSLVDVSHAVIALHLSDQLGDFAGTHAIVDADWNIHLIGNLDYINSNIRGSFQFVDQTQTHEFFLQQNEYYEDSFNSKQIQFLSQFFIDNPTCIFYGNAIVGQTILRLLHPSQFLAVYSDKWFFKNRHLVVNQTESFYEEVRLPAVWKIHMKGTCSRYTNYMRFYADLIDDNDARRKRKCPNCPLITGDCRFHLLKELAKIISYSSVLIVPDLNLIKYSMNEVIENGLDLVDVYKPSMQPGDYKSIHVFKRSVEKNWSIPLPL